jgi:hypothetical protein
MDSALRLPATQVDQAVGQGQESILEFGQGFVNILGKFGNGTKDAMVVLVTLLQEVFDDIFPDLCCCV